MKRLLPAFAILILAMASPTSPAAKVKVWQQFSPRDFDKAHFKQAVITSDRREATLAFGIRLMPLARQQRVIDYMTTRLHPPAGVSAHLAGIPVLAASSGPEALALLSADVDLVLLDILMPGMDGVDICKVMRADIELASIPVIFLSALEAGRLHAVADEAGATDYLPKPTTLTELLNLVGTHLKQ